MPSRDHRRAILLYEAAEEGAGVLNRLVAEAHTMRRIAIRALEIRHWRSKSGSWADRHDLEDTDPDCEAGCYRCLLSYANQLDHDLIDRKSEIVRDLLCRLSRTEAEVGNAAGLSAEDSFQRLMNQAGSELKRDWLKAVREGGFRLPDQAQPLLAEFSTRPDFAYDEMKALI